MKIWKLSYANIMSLFIKREGREENSNVDI